MRTVTVDVPTRFYDDHVGRDLPGGTVVRVLHRTTRVMLDQAAYDDLLSDARHYAGEAMMEFWEDDQGVILSARAAVKTLLSTPRPAV